VNISVHIMHMLISPYPSLRRKLSPKITRGKHMSLMSGYVQYGRGLKICCRTQISSNTLCGMHAVCQSLMDNQTLGFGSMMNHGLQTDSGKFRYVGSICTVLYVTNTWMNRQISQLGQSHWFSVYMQTSQNCQHLAPRRAIL